MDKLEELALQVSPEASTRWFFVRKKVLRNFEKLHRKTCSRFFFDKVAGLRPVTLLKKRLWHR